jgi:anti-sigma regulatory factor (Ser/Thr protein kinase)
MRNGERVNAARVQPRVRRPNGAPEAARRRRPAGSAVLDQAFDSRGLPALRSAVAAYAAQLGAGERLNDVILIAHELSTNVVRHGGGAGRLRLWRSGGRLMCRVTDTGPGITDATTAGTRLPAPQTGGGRGLWIARSLSALQIDTGPHGTTVTAAVAV